MARLILIDGNAIIHRAYHAIPPLTNKKGKPTNAIYGFTSMLLRVIQDLKPTHIAVCFDRKEPTFRHKSYKKYQAQRPPMEDNLFSQFQKTKDVVSSFGIPIYEKAGYEADDLLGTIAKKTQKDIQEVVIVTGDKDILQLVTKKIHVYLPVKGISQAKLMKEKDVIEKLGVKPSQIVDYKALAGDPSDNYPGVYGVGPKTAVNLIEEFGSYSKIYKNINNIPGNLQKKLKDGKEGGDISFKLAKIVTDVDFEYDLNKMAGWEVGNKKTLDLFGEIGFKTLTERIKKVSRERISKDQMNLI